MGRARAQHPNMFAAVIADAGVMDLLRYPLFTIGARTQPPQLVPNYFLRVKSFSTCLEIGSLYGVKQPELMRPWWSSLVLCASPRIVHDEGSF